VDVQVDLLLEALRKQDLEGSTLVLFTSDHGEGMDAHRWVTKLMLYEEPLRVPFIVRWPGKIAAGVVDGQHLVSGLDVLPTLCDWAEVYFPQVTGNSLRPLVENPGQEGRSFLISELYPHTEDLKMQGCCYARGASNMWCFSKARPPKCTSTLKRIQEKPATWHSTGLEWGTRTAPRSAAPMVCASGRFLRQCWWHETGC